MSTIRLIKRSCSFSARDLQRSGKFEKQRCPLYLDDILIPSKTIFKGMEKLERVLTVLTKAQS
jgi:hypothetical protein